MSDNIQLRDAAGSVTAHVDLGCFDPGQVQLSFYDDAGDDLMFVNLSAASVRKLAQALLEAAEHLEGDGA